MRRKDNSHEETKRLMVSNQQTDMVAFKSPNMLFEYFGVQGTLYKRIEDLKIYHTGGGFSKKYFQLSFSKGQLQIYKEDDKNLNNPKDKINFEDLLKVQIESENEAINARDAPQRSRSTSILSKFFGQKVANYSCPWLYEFQILT
jgi:hypothetical protein